MEHLLVRGDWDSGTFWEAELWEWDPHRLVTRFGPILTDRYGNLVTDGTHIEFSEEVFPTTAEAQAALEKSILDKVREGYLEKTVAHSAAPDELALTASSFSILASLAKHRDVRVRRNLLRNPNTPESVLKRVINGLARRKSPQDRMELVVDLIESPRALMLPGPRKLLMTLVEGLAKEGGPPTHHLMMTLGDLASGLTMEPNSDEDSSIRGVLAERSWVLAQVLTFLANEEEIVVQTEVVGNPCTPEEVLVTFAKSDHSEVRFVLASNPNCPPEVLTALAKDEEEGVRLRVAKNPSTPEKILGQLLTDSSKAFRRNLAMTRRAHPSLYRSLSGDDDPHIRVHVAENRDTPAEILAFLAKDKDVSVRREAAWNPNTPAAVLTVLASDPDGNVRRIVASHHYTPAEVLKVLAQDRDHIVCVAAWENRNFPRSKVNSLESSVDGHAALDSEYVEQDGVRKTVMVCECGWKHLIGSSGKPFAYIEANVKRRQHLEECGLGPQSDGKD